MTDLWQGFSLTLWDALLGWSLALPRDLTLLAVAGVSGVMAVGVRRWLTDQPLLDLIRRDQRRLRQRVREARSAGDRELLLRVRRIRSDVARLRFRQELRALIASGPLLATLITWGAARLEYLPPRAGEPLALTVWLPASRAGDVVHLAPADGLRVEDGWMREVKATRVAERPRGHAEWTVTAAADPAPHTLQIRLRNRTLIHRLQVGGRFYATPVVQHGQDVTTRVRLRRYRPLEFGARGTWLGLPPWLVVYLLLTIAFYVAARCLLRVK